MATADAPSPLERLGLLTSGGDAPGMNAAIRAATIVAIQSGIEVLGVRDGYRGLLAGDLEPLGSPEVAGILREGGTVLGSARAPEMHQRETRDRAREVLREHRLDGLIVIGGNGSLEGARALSDPAEAGAGCPRVLGIPASIDNDIGLTGLAIGVDTAMNTIVEACDKICDTASAHERTFIVEVMGRDCGYLAMTAAVASGAQAVLFREAGRSEAELVESVVRTIERVYEREGSRHRVLIVKAEGVGVPVDRLKTLVDRRLKEKAGLETRIETRVTVLGHLVRGGRPSAFDRLLASRLARVAVRALQAGHDRRMAGWLLPAAPSPGEEVLPAPSDPYCRLVHLDAVARETQRLMDGTSPLVEWRVRALEEVEDVLPL